MNTYYALGQIHFLLNTAIELYRCDSLNQWHSESGALPDFQPMAVSLISAAFVYVSKLTRQSRKDVAVYIHETPNIGLGDYCIGVEGKRFIEPVPLVYHLWERGIIEDDAYITYFDDLYDHEQRRYWRLAPDVEGYEQLKPPPEH